MTPPNTPPADAMEAARKWWYRGEFTLESVTEAFGAFAEKRAEALDDPQWDATDAAHPAWWRGNDAGVAVTVSNLADILDGKDNGAGVCGYAPLEALRRRLLVLRDAEKRAAEAVTRFADVTDRTEPRPDVSLEARIAALKYIVANFRDIRSVFPDIDVMLNKDTLRAALATLEAARWRPIAEAPKDGTRLLLAFESGHVTMGWACSETEFENSLGVVLVAPTHFRPLPEPPSDG